MKFWCTGRSHSSSLIPRMGGFRRYVPGGSEATCRRGIGPSHQSANHTRTQGIYLGWEPITSPHWGEARNMRHACATTKQRRRSRSGFANQAFCVDAVLTPIDQSCEDARHIPGSETNHTRTQGIYLGREPITRGG
eukprot:2268427-Pyramimonas_sp.AAC.1